MVTLKKYHGLGNDYLIYDPNQNRELLQDPSKEELETMDYRSKKEIEGQVRIVTIEGCDRCISEVRCL